MDDTLLFPANDFGKLVSFFAIVKLLKGFGACWSKWIRGCCVNSNFSMLINGRSRGKIQAPRGIRQGDLLSLFLFTIVANSLSLFIHVCRGKGFIRGFKVGKDVLGT